MKGRLKVLSIQKSIKIGTNDQQKKKKISGALIRRVILDSRQPCGTTADEILASSYNIYFQCNLLELYNLFLSCYLLVQILDRKKLNWHSSASGWIPFIQLPNLILLYRVKSDIGHLDLYIELGATGRAQVSSAGQNVSSAMSFPLSQLFSQFNFYFQPITVAS